MRKSHAAYCDRRQDTINRKQPTDGRPPSATIELFKKQKPRDDRGQAYETLNQIPDFVWLAECETKNRISDNEDNSVENREQTKPKEELFMCPSPKHMHDDGSGAKGSNHGAHNQQSNRTLHYVAPLAFSLGLKGKRSVTSRRRTSARKGCSKRQRQFAMGGNHSITCLIFGSG
jgi:hypothetical protein